MSVIVLTFKRLEQAKQRLAPVLSPREREELARQMFLDLVQALLDSRRVCGVFLVSADAWAGQLASRHGWQWLREEIQESESQSVDWASTVLSARGVESVLRLPCDIPLTQGGDVDALLEVEVPYPGALIVPSQDRDGTNALLRRPPGAFSSRFGPDSFRLHLQAAETAGVPLTILKNERIGLDIDEPADLMEAVRRGKGTRTVAFLKDLEIPKRLKENGEQRMASGKR